MFDEVVLGREFFERLLKFDAQITEEVRRRRCPRCGGPLHRGDYERKPREGRGVSAGPAETRRFSLCCGRVGCRRRATPPSLRFLGRRVYVEATVLIASVIGLAVDRSKALAVATAVPARTVRRWRAWWAGPFAASTVFAEVCSRSVGLDASKSPASFLERMVGTAAERISLAAEWLAPLTTMSVADGSRFVRALKRRP